MSNLLSATATSAVPRCICPHVLSRCLSSLVGCNGDEIPARHNKAIHARQEMLGKNVWNNISRDTQKRLLSTKQSNWSAFKEVLSNITPEKLSETDVRVEDSQVLFDTLRIYQLVKGYERWGYLHANTDPLKIPKEPPFVTSAYSKMSVTRPTYEKYGFSAADLDKTFDFAIPGVSGFLSANREPCTLREIVQRLEETFCGSIGLEFLHIADAKAHNFIRERFETVKRTDFSNDMKCRILIRTMRAQLFENFCAQKFSTTKRFGCDGVETMIVLMKEITKRACSKGVNSVMVGMPHRGRLNLLMNCMHKPMAKIMNEFKGLMGFAREDWGSLGDVKYHLGVEFDHFDVDSKKYIHMGVLANPSHLEAVDPLVCGQARAQQYFKGETSGKTVLPVIFHGDASFAGQGIVYETLQMSQLPAYSVGGTIHIIVNNQIGFTTNVVDSGSGVTCVSLSRAIDAPVFHVNADDPEAVTRVAQVALDYRLEFGTDVFINLIGYRRYGHNELDMPKFTQPQMYSLIEKHKPVLEIYRDRLMKEGVIDQAYFDEKKKITTDFYNEQYESSKTFSDTTSPNEYTPQWQKMNRPNAISPPRTTGLSHDLIVSLGKEISTLPDTVAPHPTIAKLYKARVTAIETGKGVDFGLAEALAYGSLLQEGFHVRLTGQDAQRGTFSHRHAYVHDQNKLGERYCPLANMKTRHRFEVHNSLLSEYAALGFEIGYSLENPDALVIWEAQFGDFANTAQVMVDQFIASGEVKWNRQTGITLLLPHGYDGQGPEHSSARVERYLQLCDDREDVIHPENWDVAKRSVIQKHNMQVVMPSTPANHFHVLRRQMIRGFRKPLIIFSPKKLLKLRACVSDLADLADGTRFQRYIADDQSMTADKNSSIRRLIVCSGQLYYDLAAHRLKHNLSDCAISRVEQLSPFPFDKFIDDVKTYPNLESIVWAQEEPMNAGPWPYVSMRMRSSLAHMNQPNGITCAIFAGRDVAAAPAVGDAMLHQQQQEVILHAAFDHNQCSNVYYENYMSKA